MISLLLLEPPPNRHQLALHRQRRLRRLLRLLHGPREVPLFDARAPRVGLQHQHLALHAGQQQVQLRRLLRLAVRVHHHLPPLHNRHPRRAYGPVEGHARQHQRGGGTHDAQHVRVLRPVAAEHVERDVRLPGEPLGEERADRAVHSTGEQNLPVLGAALPPGEGGGDAPHGVGALAVVHLEGEEVGVGVVGAGAHGGGEHAGVAQANEDGAVGEVGEAAGLQGEGRAPLRAAADHNGAIANRDSGGLGRRPVLGFPGGTILRAR
mmetsp:Transcript_15341/g.52402  ORF Transcript_15341/g.52402 Transcript_15341/m.52402 type:complete len:265 (+) Transcript_15341:1610-2404(+)